MLFTALKINLGPFYLFFCVVKDLSWFVSGGFFPLKKRGFKPLVQFSHHLGTNTFGRFNKNLRNGCLSVLLNSSVIMIVVLDSLEVELFMDIL